MSGFRHCLGFLTSLPVTETSEKFDPSGMLVYFPLVGLFLGLILAGLDWLFLQIWPLFVVSILDVIVLALLTGGLHVDGLGDTADGIFCQGPKDKILQVMKDSRVGVMGLLAIIFTLAVKWGGLANISEHRTLLLLLIPAYSRASMLFGFSFLPYGREEGGTAYAFFEHPVGINAYAGLALPVIISFFLGWSAVFLNLLFLCLSFLLILYFRRRLGWMTGDTLGAMCEIVEAMLFLLMSASLGTSYFC